MTLLLIYTVYTHMTSIIWFGVTSVTTCTVRHFHSLAKRWKAVGFATSARTMAAGDRRSDHQAVTLVTRHIIMDVYAHTAMLGWRVTGVTLWGQAWYRLRPEDASA